MIFLDTNIFLRYFVKIDNEKENQRIENFFESIVEGKIICFTNAMVIIEIIWVLEKYYEWLKQEVCDNIELILNTPNIKIKEKKVLQSAIEIYREINIDFIDIYNYCYIKEQNASEIYSFDTHFDKLSELYGEIKRLVP